MEADVLIIGGGAAGTVAALLLAKAGKHCIILEKNGQIGRKLRITGKGRCNLTNACDLDTLMANVPRNPKFLYSAFARWMPEDVMAYFEQLGVPLKVERGNRVFPVSDRAEDIVAALQRALKRAGIPVYRETVQQLLLQEGRCTGVQTASGKQYAAKCVLLAAGGASYPATGSTGDGYTLAKQAGHTIVPPKPSLVPLECSNNFIPKLQGLSLKNIEITLFEDEKAIYSDFGEMIFTHFGVSGPVILSASSHIKNMGKKKYKIKIDLKPALDFNTLDKRICRDFEEFSNKDFVNSLSKLLPKKLIPVIVSLSGISPGEKVNQITRQQRLALVDLIKNFYVTISNFRPSDEAIITCGGVSVKEINPKTMCSKIIDNLYFAGEIIDVDAYTGGFNLQIAFSTAVLCADNM